MSRHFVSSNAEAIELGLAGFCALNADLVRLHAEPRFVVRAESASNKVALVSGGGSGHEPLHAGFVGEGMLDAAVPGEVFASPSAEQVRIATMAADNGRGVLHVVKNYTGDVINFALAADQCREAGVEVATVLVDDDIPGAERGSKPGRRGTVATVVVEKICGAAAEAGLDLAQLKELGYRVVDNARSVGAAIVAGTHFGADSEDFTLQADQIEFGVGIHGERGTDRIPDEGLSALIAKLVDTIASDTDSLAGPQLLIMNGLGSTTPLELHAAYALAAARLGERGAEIVRAVVDDLVTSLDMRGLSLTVVRLDDDLLRWWDAPARTPAWRMPPSAPAIEPAVFVPAEGRVAAETSMIDAETAAVLNRWLAAFEETVDAQAKALGDLDRRAGDGDFGENLLTALGRFRNHDHDQQNPFLSLSAAFASVGGTSGPILALWLGTLGRHLAHGLSSATLAAGLAEAADRVQELGGAAPGDKTMVDAMVPAAAAAADGSGEFAAALDRAAHAAREAAEETIDLVASRGRASYVGETSRGVGDPGAIAIALFLEAGSFSLGD
ncbi:dihydroxyacetone kinase family protein [Propionibacteriaceae bacterium Y1700]|uniref:dihydroxyacetone kinase family protein n=1 Tax=Microlunatus sp. Y1700 TaxID=3418487 RepID=UPI003DA70AAC